ncbi:MAG: nucleotidyltransferase domain-containing protein [Niameybacter sp.]
MLNTLNSFEDLSDKSKSVVKSILDIINDFDKNNELEVFLFGSYAKGKVRVDSDIDLKMYYVEDFYASSKQSIFEMEIAKYMIKIK